MNLDFKKSMQLATTVKGEKDKPIGRKKRQHRNSTFSKQSKYNCLASKHEKFSDALWLAQVFRLPCCVRLISAFRSYF